MTTEAFLAEMQARAARLRESAAADPSSTSLGGLDPLADPAPVRPEEPATTPTAAVEDGGGDVEDPDGDDGAAAAPTDQAESRTPDPVGCGF